MPLFTYRAVDEVGRMANGRLDAVNAIDLELRLKRMGLDLVTFKAARAAVSFLPQRVPRKELINFCFHLRQLMAAGIPIVDALTDIRDSIEAPQFKPIGAALLEEIEGGLKLSEAMEKHPEAFDTVFVSLIRAGELSGQLPEVLDKLVDNLKWQDELATQTRQALLYPAFTGVVIVGVIVALMTLLVPQLVSVMKTLQPQLPTETRVLLAVSDIFVRYWWAILGLPLAAFITLKIVARNSHDVQVALDRWRIEAPFVGPIFRKIALARFSTFFSLLYASGISVLEGLRTCEKVVGNRVLEDGVQRAGRLISEGQSIAQAFQTTNLFPPLVVRMLRVGEATGGLDTALRNVAYFYNRETRESIDRLQKLLGPMLTLFLGVVLLLIIITIFSPLYDVITRVKL